MHATPKTIAVGLAIARAPDRDHWAAELARATNIKILTVMDILGRMTHAGWLTRRAAENVQWFAGQPYSLYRLTDEGLAAVDSLRQAADKPPCVSGAPRGAGTRPGFRPVESYDTGTCPACRKREKVRTDGLLAGHGPRNRRCPGSWELPLESETCMVMLPKTAAGASVTLDVAHIDQREHLRGADRIRPATNPCPTAIMPSIDEHGSRQGRPVRPATGRARRQAPTERTTPRAAHTDLAAVAADTDTEADRHTAARIAVESDQTARSCRGLSPLGSRCACPAPCSASRSPSRSGTGAA